MHLMSQPRLACRKHSDCFHLYALKGRLFFEVAERDKTEQTLLIIGTGGSGKSTDLKAQMQFWPHWLRGVLTANIQAQFGMSAVARGGKARVIFCNEMNGDPSVTQEEWQTGCSGEWGSYAVKFQQNPLIMRWIAQMFWVGNKAPVDKWNNLQKQVARRLPGVSLNSGGQSNPMSEMSSPFA